MSYSEFLGKGKNPYQRSQEDIDKLVRDALGISSTAPTYGEFVGPTTPEHSAPTTLPTTTPVLSYEEYISGEKTRLEESKNKTLENIETKRLEAHTAAEKERERSVVDARTSYQQNLAEYGAKAEALASMGLTGSGYSDYLNANAYAQQRSDIKAAKAVESAAKSEADSNANDLKLAAELSYEQNLSDLNEKGMLYQKEEEATIEEAYYNLFDSAKSGNYTAEEIRDIAASRGMSDEQIVSLTLLASDTIAKKQALADATSYSQAGDMVGYYNSLAKAGEITTAQAQNQIYNLFIQDIKVGTFDISKLSSAGLTPEQSKSIQLEWSKTLDTTTNTTIFKDTRDTSGNTQLSKIAASSVLNEIKKMGGVSQEIKDALQDTYDTLYVAKTGDVKFNWDWADGRVDDEDYENIGGSDQQFQLIIGNEIKEAGVTPTAVTDSIINEAAKDVSNKHVFGINDKLYIKWEGKCYELYSKDDADWKQIKNEIFG